MLPTTDLSGSFNFKDMQNRRTTEECKTCKALFTQKRWLEIYNSISPFIFFSPSRKLSNSVSQVNYPFNHLLIRFPAPENRLIKLLSGISATLHIFWLQMKNRFLGRQRLYLKLRPRQAGSDRPWRKVLLGFFLFFRFHSLRYANAGTVRKIAVAMTLFSTFYFFSEIQSKKSKVTTIQVKYANAKY